MSMKKQRGFIDLGPPWMWRVAGYLMLFGFFSAVALTGYLLWLLVTHLVFV